jgi:hypothetical protein
MISKLRLNAFKSYATKCLRKLTLKLRAHHLMGRNSSDHKFNFTFHHELYSAPSKHSWSLSTSNIADLYQQVNIAGL